MAHFVADHVRGVVWCRDATKLMPAPVIPDALDRAFIPLVVGEVGEWVRRSDTWGDAPGWYETAPLVLARARHRPLRWWEKLLYQPVLATFETFWKKQGGKSTSRASMNTPGARQILVQNEQFALLGA